MAELAALLQRFYDRVTGRPAEWSDGELVASGDLDVYASMYAIRLYDALADDYPKLKAALGDEPFNALARDYYAAHPPRSFTLRDAGIALPDYLREAAFEPRWAADLAALERARVEVFDGADAQPLVHGDLVELGAALPELVLSWVPSSVVVRIGWAVDDLWSAIEDEQPVLEPAEQPRTVLVWRRELSVLHRTLDADEAELAQQVAIGMQFSEVCEVLAGLHGEDATPRAAELLMRWLEAEAITAP